jgi:hypothetical protein
VTADAAAEAFAAAVACLPTVGALADARPAARAVGANT